MAPDELEERLAQLPRGRVKDSFQILAEWLKENRESLQAQLAGLAIRFEEVNREDKRRLEEIHQETRKTNGRVTDLERTRELAAALNQDHHESETAHEQAEREQAERDDKETERHAQVEEREKERQALRREKRRDRLVSVGLVILGLVGAKALQALGLS